MTEMLTSALGYADRGWPVVPLHEYVDGRCTCSEPFDCAETRSEGKHPRTKHGLDDASTDRAVIAVWWKKWPTANIGLVTGVCFDVVDLDGPGAIDRIEAHGDLERGPMAVSGRPDGGVHSYVQRTGEGNRQGVKLDGRTAGSGVDYRGKGGYIIAPPSVHKSGAVYRWYLTPDDLPLPAVSAWFLRALRREVPQPQTTKGTARAAKGSSYGKRAMESELGRLALAAVGERNGQLNASAYALGQLVAGKHLDTREAAAALLAVATRVGLSESEAKKTIASGMKSGAASPRRAA